MKGIALHVKALPLTMQNVIFRHAKRNLLGNHDFFFAKPCVFIRNHILCARIYIVISSVFINFAEENKHTCIFLIKLTVKTVKTYTMRKKIILLFLSCFSLVPVNADELVWFGNGKPVTLSVQKRTDPVVTVALRMFNSDMRMVTDAEPQRADMKRATIQIVQLDKAGKAEKQCLMKAGVDTDFLRNGTDAFVVKVHEGRILVAGGNGRGTAYGLLELSRIAGVSPWVWWGDVTPERKPRLTIATDYMTKQSASVEKRGIFINDEDWSLRPWSSSDGRRITTDTYRRVFELLLRLRANAVWPAMHEGTEAFFANPWNKIVADSCGIFIGTSHCEPLLRNNVGEWNVRERGAFNYRTNREAVQNYWTDRLKEVSKSSTNMFTIGMRGIHDGSMEGYKTADEKFHALQQVIDDQQQLIAKHIGDPRKQMQVFVPYKEVLELYTKGLRVPETATLMWCDDNYGYITRLSDPREQQRQGGAGVYYHLSYWGRPHDHLWLTTTQPGLIFHQMRQAYDHNVRKLWIANVHDPKVSAYDLELFLDMAWNIDCVNGSTLDNHLKQWLTTQFGAEAANALAPAMKEFYRLCGIRRPEFMGWSQVERDKKIYDRGLSPVRNSEFSTTQFGNELDRYLDDYHRIVAVVDSVAKRNIPARLHDAFFAAVEYPVKSAAFNAVKMLEAQRARQLSNGKQAEMKAACVRSLDAYRRVMVMTDYYNNDLANGKWHDIMDNNPRRLPSMGAPVLPYLFTDEDVKAASATETNARKYHAIDLDGVVARNASSFTTAPEGTAPVKMLGHSMNAVPLQKGGTLTYDFTFDHEGEANLTVALIPTQPNDSGDLRFQVSIDGAEPTVFSLKEPFRSEQWKVNVLRGQARRTLKVNLSKGSHRLEIKALDPNIVVDQWMIDPNLKRGTHYLIPVK